MTDRNALINRILECRLPTVSLYTDEALELCRPPELPDCLFWLERELRNVPRGPITVDSSRLLELIRWARKVSGK